MTVSWIQRHYARNLRVDIQHASRPMLGPHARAPRGPYGGLHALPGFDALRRNPVFIIACRSQEQNR